MTTVSVFYLLIFVIGVLLGVIGVLVYRLLQAEAEALHSAQLVDTAMGVTRAQRAALDRVHPGDISPNPQHWAGGPMTELSKLIGDAGSQPAPPEVEDDQSSPSPTRQWATMPHPEWLKEGFKEAERDDNH